MGNNCCKKKVINETIINENGTLSKFCGEKELLFWEEVKDLGLVKISKFNKQNKLVEFNFSDLFMENFISVSRIMENYELEQNFFYFTSLYEITIALLDFISVIFTLKKKYGINKENFFLINFEKFYLTKEGNSHYYSKLVYIDEKLNDNFSCPEILYKEENNNMLSSFSVIEGEQSKSVQMLLTTINSSNVNYKSTMSIDLNSYFYSKCNDRYQYLKDNYSLENCNKFYAENIYNFVCRFLLKKVSICDQAIEHHFSNMKFLLRHVLNQYFKSGEKMNLQNLKMILSNFYLNNFEFGVLKDALEEKLKIQDGNRSLDKNIMDKIISFNQVGVSLIYGECDIDSDSILKTAHKISFINDHLLNSKFNVSQNTPNHNINSNPMICINCAYNIISKKSPDGRSNFISIQKFSEELTNKHFYVDLNFHLQYLCSYFESVENTKRLLEQHGQEIHIYRKNKHCVTFELIEWDEYQEEVLKNDIINLDFNVKNRVSQTRNSKLDRNSMIPSPKFNV